MHVLELLSSPSISSLVYMWHKAEITRQTNEINTANATIICNYYIPNVPFNVINKLGPYNYELWFCPLKYLTCNLLPTYLILLGR